jgi:hypothetical protein
MRRSLGLFLMLYALQAHAVNDIIWGEQDKLGNFEYDFDANAKPWQELQGQLPPYPKEGNLIEFEVSAASRNRFYLDYNALTLGKDGVVRFTVVIRSPSGAETVNFEGLRCETGERKLYAFGHGDGKGGGAWSRNRFARWQPMPTSHTNGYELELFEHYLCTVDTAGDLKKIQYAVKHGGVGQGD